MGKLFAVLKKIGLALTYPIWAPEARSKVRYKDQEGQDKGA